MIGIRRRAVIIAVGAASLWVAFVGWLVPWLIGLGYREEGPDLLNGVFAGRASNSIESYLDSWWPLAMAATAGLLAVSVLVFVAHAFPIKRRMAVGWLVAGTPGLTPVQLVSSAAGLGAVGGLAEAGVRVARHLALHQPGAGFYWEVVWLAPLSATLAALVVAPALLLLGWVADSTVSVAKATWLFALTGAFGALGASGLGLHPMAQALLALGLATAISRAVAPRVRSPARMARWSRVFLGALTTGLLVFGVLGLPPVRERWAAVGSPDQERRLPNILLVILDTVRASNLSLYGYERPTTPHLDAWAEAGAVFDWALSTASWTLPAHATLFTGRYHYEVRTGPSAPLAEAYPTLAEVLAEHGYATAGFAGNLAYTTRQSGLDQGFARYEDRRLGVTHVVAASWIGRTIAAALVPSFEVPEDLLVRGDLVTGAFLDWLDEDRDRPFFAFLNYFDAHHPYEPPEPYRERFGPQPSEDYYAFEERWWSEPAKPYDPEEIQPWVDMYDGAISYVDAQLGRLRDALIERSLVDNTLVVIVGDHGELFAERGQIMHTWSLYAPVLHVPLVIVAPGDVPRGLRISREVTVRDLAATILDLADLAAESPLPGESWTGLWDLGDEFSGSSPVLSEAERAPDLDFRPRTPLARGDMSALLEGGLHYIRNGDGSQELYNVLNDPKLLVDLAPDTAYAPALRHLRGRLDSLDVARER